MLSYKEIFIVLLLAHVLSDFYFQKIHGNKKENECEIYMDS